MTRNGIPHDLALRPRPSSTFPAVISAASGSSPLRKTKLSALGLAEKLVALVPPPRVYT